MRAFSFVIQSALCLPLLTACVIGNQFAHSGNNASVTLGNIEVKQGQTAGHLDVVNGNIEVADNARIKTAETTNGNIEIGESSYTSSLETINGNITLGSRANTNGDISTVNGNITLNPDVIVFGSLSTHNGDVTLKRDVRVEGDIVFESSSWTGFSDAQRKPVLRIEQGAKLSGEIILYNLVELQLPSDFPQEKIIDRTAK